jgi:hypothetical protein
VKSIRLDIPGPERDSNGLPLEYMLGGLPLSQATAWRRYKRAGYVKLCAANLTEEKSSVSFSEFPTGLRLSEVCYKQNLVNCTV